MTKYLLLFGIVLCTMQSIAQNYDRALGARIGVTSGIEYKKFHDDISGFDVIFSFQRGGVQFTYLQLYHYPIMLHSDGQFLFYCGFGGHLGYSRWSKKKVRIDNYTYRRKKLAFGVAINVIVGIEYQLPHYPMVVSFDYKPYYEVGYPGYFEKNNYDFAVSIKYTF